MIETTKAIKIMRAWYNRTDVKYEMIFNFLKRREFACIKPKCYINQECQGVRCLRVYNIEGFDYSLNHMINFERQQAVLNLYYSLAKYEEGLPHFGSELYLRNDNHLMDNWKDNHWRKMISYDCLIDIDSPDRESMSVAKENANQIRIFLDRLGVPYYLRFSGMGYHIVIPYEAFVSIKTHFNPNEDLDHSVYCLFNDITKALYDRFSELVDTGLHDSRRILKMPYSLAFYNDGVFLCWCFYDKFEFLAHKYTDYQLTKDNYFAGETTIFKRGQTLFNKENLLNSLPITNLLKELKLTRWLR